MSIHITVPYVTSGLNVYAILRRVSDGQYWTGSGYEVFNASNWTTYAQALTEQGSTGVYAGTFSPDDGNYSFDARKRVGASAATTDALIATSGTFAVSDGIETVFVGGPVESVEGDVGGNIVGSVSSVSGDIGGNLVGDVGGDVVGSVAGNVDGTVILAESSLTAEKIADGALDGKGNWALQGDQMDFVDAPNATALAAIAAGVWAAGTRTLTSFGTLVSSIWANSSRTLSDISADLLALLFTRNTTKTYADAVAGSVVKEAADNAAGLTAQEAADALKLSPTAGSPATGSVYAELDAIQLQTGLITGGRIIARSAIVDSGQHLILVRGDDYNVASGQPLEWTDPNGNWPTLTSATITLTIRTKESDGSGGAVVLTQAGSVVTAGGDNKKVRVEPLTAKTSLLTPGSKVNLFDVEAVLSTGERVTLIVGQCTVIEDMTTT